MTPAGLELDTAERPYLSIIVPAFNQFDATLACLDSIARHPPTTQSYEVILIDDASTDERMATLAEVSGLKILRNDTNLGFLHSVNKAAAEALGAYLLLLNNDAIVTAGAIDELLATFSLMSEVGVVGPKLLFPDGTLQDGGGIVWRDGSAWNYGRGLHRNEPTHNYARQVDYIAGAALMISRFLWEQLGGFDEAYAPAYYEDTDLCLRVKKNLGLKVIYQPTAVVYHDEGTSYGVDTSQEGKHHQEANRAVFRQRWLEELATQHADNGTAPELEKERGVTFRALVLDARTLYPDRDSGSLRMRNMLSGLQSCGAKVTFVPHNLLAEDAYATELRRSGIEVWGRPFLRSVVELLKNHGRLYDLVILSRHEVASVHMEDVRRYCPKATVVYDTVDLHFVRRQRELEVTGGSPGEMDVGQMMAGELRAIEAADITLVCSTTEQQLLRAHLPDADVRVLSNIHGETPTKTPVGDRDDLLFVGSFEHPPNADAVIWFVDEVLPLIHAVKPDVRVHIVGSDPPADVLSRANATVIVHGHVPDLQAMYERVRISIAPLRYGAGVKGKVTQAMASGVPIVGSPMAVEGAGIEAGVHCLVGAGPDEFAAAVNRLLCDDDLWAELRRAGLQLTKQRYSPWAARSIIDSLCTTALEAGR